MRPSLLTWPRRRASNFALLLEEGRRSRNRSVCRPSEFPQCARLCPARQPGAGSCRSPTRRSCTPNAGPASARAARRPRGCRRGPAEPQPALRGAKRGSPRASGCPTLAPRPSPSSPATSSPARSSSLAPSPQPSPPSWTRAWARRRRTRRPSGPRFRPQQRRLLVFLCRRPAPCSVQGSTSPASCRPRFSCSPWQYHGTSSCPWRPS
mmetsp:Transcript_45312/g.115058  ORF Transcript_45312/g.115058 Transcript_45312/m.115058 type:complete len:208 (+) Transcript_45312:1168-1791(+)